MQQRIHQRAAIVLFASRANMHRHSGGLVDDYQIAIFINDFKRNIFSEGSERGDLHFSGDDDVLTLRYLVRSLDRAVIQQNLALLDQQLHTRAAYIRNGSGEKLIETPAGVLGL